VVGVPEIVFMFFFKMNQVPSQSPHFHFCRTTAFFLRSFHHEPGPYTIGATHISHTGVLPRQSPRDFPGHLGKNSEMWVFSAKEHLPLLPGSFQ
jgi:hypothetical protein